MPLRLGHLRWPSFSELNLITIEPGAWGIDIIVDSAIIALLSHIIKSKQNKI